MGLEDSRLNHCIFEALTPLIEVQIPASDDSTDSAPSIYEYLHVNMCKAYAYEYQWHCCPWKELGDPITDLPRQNKHIQKLRQ
jgi:hypothetical protein